MLFAQTDNPAGNEIPVYDRASDGTLVRVDTVGTGDSVAGSRVPS